MLINRLISAGTPLADAATPNAIPKGITNAAMGAISTLPRQTPFAVKHGRLDRLESRLSPDMRNNLRPDLSSRQSGYGRLTRISVQRRLLGKTGHGPTIRPDRLRRF